MIFSTKNILSCVMAGCFIAALSGCSNLNIFEEAPDPILEGERLSLYDFEKMLQQDSNTKFGMAGADDLPQDADNVPSTQLHHKTDVSLALDSKWENNFWPQVGGYPNHAMKHVVFNPDDSDAIWSYSVGTDDIDRAPLTAAPVIADNKVFALNNRAEVIAVSADKGKKIWKTNIVKLGEEDPVIGGGIGFSGGRLFATNGFNEVVALNANTGDILWRTQTKAPVRGAPAALPHRVFVTTMNNETVALDAHTGEKLWSHRGLNHDAELFGSPTPALTRDAVIATYGSGEVYALQINTGAELWSENLSPLTKSAGQTRLNDIQALPVVDSHVAYIATHGNQMVAIDTRSGKTIWTSPVGTRQTPWISGNRIYAIDAQGALTSIDRGTGRVVWQSPLPQFEDEKRKKHPITWNGPYLTNGSLLIIGSHGVLFVLDPVDGVQFDEQDIADLVRLPVSFAQGRMVFLTNKGRLVAMQ